MKQVLPFLLLVLLFTACSEEDEQQERKPPKYVRYFDQSWAQQKLWDDGNAEVATYAAERVVYGKVRHFEFTLITVKEDFNRQHNVKTDSYNRDDLFPVMKINQFYSLRTDNYPYHYLTSVFLKREDPVRLHKLTTTSQEWCGNVSKSVQQRPEHYMMKYDSYWDGEGRGDKKLPPDLLFEDQLLYTLRSLRFRDGLHFAAPLAETMQTNRATKPLIYQANINVSSASVSGTDSLQQPAWHVELRLAHGKRNHYWFSQVYPNVLLRFESHDGRKLQLKELRRFAYWKGD